MIAKVRLIGVGRMLVPGPEVFFQRRFGEWLPLTLWAAVVQDEHHTILINTGSDPRDATILPDLDHVPEGGIVAALAQIGLQPEDVSHVILTPLQAYAVGSVDRFPRAEIFVSRTGWVDFHAPSRPVTVAERQRQVPGHVLKYLTGSAFVRMRLITSSVEVLEGVTATWVGCHHRSSLVIWIRAGNRTLAFTDVVFHADNLDRMIPIGIGEDRYECLDAYRRLRQEADEVLGLYDPGLSERYPGGLVFSL